MGKERIFKMKEQKKIAVKVKLEFDKEEAEKKLERINQLKDEINKELETIPQLIKFTQIK